MHNTQQQHRPAMQGSNTTRSTRAPDNIGHAAAAGAVAAGEGAPGVCRHINRLQAHLGG